MYLHIPALQVRTALDPTIFTKSSSGFVLEMTPPLSSFPAMSPLNGPGVLFSSSFVFVGRSISLPDISFSSSDTISCTRSSTGPAEFCATHE